MPAPPVLDAAQSASPSAAPSVHVTATLVNRFVEFEFVLGDPDLSVELVLEGAQFAEFCRAQRVARMDVAPAARPAWERLRQSLHFSLPALAS